MSQKYKILGLLGDGIADEIIPEGLNVLKAVEDKFGLDLEILGPYPVGAKYWVDHDLKRGWPEDLTEELFYEADAIFKGPTGLPGLVGKLPGYYTPIKMRTELDLYANIRPCRLRPGVKSVLVWRKPGDIDYIILRENTEQMYVNIGGFMKRGGETELAIDNYVQTKKGCERIIKYGFNLARSSEYKGKIGAPLDGKRRLTCACKWGLTKGDDLFKDSYEKIAKENKDIERDST